MKRKVIFDVDTGSDDAIELIYAIKSKKLDILGITTIFGSDNIHETTKHTLQILDLLNVNIPVYKGCVKSLCTSIYDNGEPIGIRKNKTIDCNGEVIGFHEVFGNEEAKKTYNELHAVTYIIDTLKNSSERITLVCSGCLTNIAVAFRLAPEIKDNIEEMVIMGGGINVSNKTAWAEGNFFRDPEAAKIVLESGCKITLITLDATHSVTINNIDLEKLRKIKTQESKFICKVIEMRIKAYNLLQPLPKDDVCIIHDLLCTFYLLDEKIIEEKKNYQSTICISHDEGCGKLLVDQRENNTKSNISIVLKVNENKYKQLLFNILNN